MKKISLLLLVIATCRIQAAIPPLQINTVNITPLSCNVISEAATITVNAIGGQPPYEFSFDFGPFQSENTFVTEKIGIIQIIVHDSALPTPNESFAQITTGPSALTNVTFDITQFPCLEGNGSFSVTGIKPLANPPAIFPAVFVLKRGEITINPTPPVEDGAIFRADYTGTIEAGDFTMNVTAGGPGIDCQPIIFGFSVKKVSPVTITSVETLSEDTPITGGTIRINVEGGSGDLLFGVGPQGGKPQIIQENNPIFTGLAAGAFIVAVQDQASACIDEDSDVATVDAVANAIAQFLLTKNC